jgi:hypothetical protein
LAATALVLGLAACTPVNVHYNADKAHHRPSGFVNSDPSLSIGEFPWYEILLRNLRGDFRPVAVPEGGYEAFARTWRIEPDRARLAVRVEAPQITWLGHASLLLQVANMNILIDPQFSATAGPDLGFVHLGAPRHVAPPLEPEALPPIDLVLISHNHYDHLDHATLKRMLGAGQKPRFVVPLGLKAVVRRTGHRSRGRRDGLVGQPGLRGADAALHARPALEQAQPRSTPMPACGAASCSNGAIAPCATSSRNSKASAS